MFINETGRKAIRLVQEGRVSFAQGVAVVRGDHDTYLVRPAGSRWTCSCPWGVGQPDGKPCSHALAAELAKQVAQQIEAPAAPATATPVNPSRGLFRCPECRAACHERFCGRCGWSAPALAAAGRL